MSTNQASVHSGMGAILYEGGTAFRVWAPNAASVHVAGSFNDWNRYQYPLVHEDNGYWSLDIDGIESGEQYKFVLLYDGQSLWRNDPYARDVTGSNGNSVIVDTSFDWGSEVFTMPSWHELVIYEMHLGTFHDQRGGPPGNLESAMQKLPYLRDLGINAVQIMPPAEFPMDISWGYNPAHLFAIEDAYGGPKALKAFIRTAHENGIAVIFDVVFNHLGPNDLDIWRFDGWHKDGKGGVYFYNDWRSDTPWGPRPDYGRGEVRQFLRDNALMWLKEFHADGLRWDATAYIRNTYGNDNDLAHDISDGWTLMQWINNEIDVRQPWKISIAEDLRNNAWVVKEPEQGGAGFDAQWSGAFVYPVREAIISGNDNHRSMYAVRDAIYQRYNSDAYERVIYTESHDEVANGKQRVPEEIWPGNAGSWYSKKRSTLGAGLVFTSPGIPMLFQGQEILEDQWFHDKDPIDWSKLETYAGIWKLYRDLIRLRRNWFNNTRGLRGQHVHVHHVNDKDKLLAFHRWDQGGPHDSVVMVANFAKKTYENYRLGFPREGLWKVRFNSDWNGYDGEFGNHFSYDTLAIAEGRDSMPASANVAVGPYSILILSQDE